MASSYRNSSDITLALGLPIVDTDDDADADTVDYANLGFYYDALGFVLRDGRYSS